MNKTLLLSTMGLLLCGLPPCIAETLTLFAAAATIPVREVKPGDELVSKTLKGADLINLAMGRPLGTKIDPKKEVLALAVVSEGPGDVAMPATRVIVYNPDPAVMNDADHVKATVFTLSTLSYDAALVSGKPTGQGIGTAAVVATPPVAPDPGGDSTKNALFATTLNVAASAVATLSPADNSMTSFKLTLKGAGGPFHFKYTDAKTPVSVEIDGIVVAAAFTTTGKPLDVLLLP